MCASPLLDGEEAQISHLASNGAQDNEGFTALGPGKLLWVPGEPHYWPVGVRSLGPSLAFSGAGPGSSLLDT